MFAKSDINLNIAALEAPTTGLLEIEDEALIGKEVAVF